MPELSKDATDNLEKIVDHYDLEHIIRALSFICSEKSTHVAETWQDIRLAKVWMNCSIILDAALTKLEDLNAEA